ncbi:hypothetical protein ABZ342_26540 [Amycolatopsis sp. NPDC005961]|uniref:hypothetical protein n=1 Tax=Amycolatopsis sp. NPDC005961 TaxID=3156720 RepID=UPI0033DF5909
MPEKPAPHPQSAAGAAARQRTCAACGARFAPDERTGLEVLIDGEIRYVAVHSGHTTHASARDRLALSRLPGPVAAAPTRGTAA